MLWPCSSTPPALLAASRTPEPVVMKLGVRTAQEQSLCVCRCWATASYCYRVNACSYRQLQLRLRFEPTDGHIYPSTSVSPASQSTTYPHHHPPSWAGAVDTECQRVKWTVSPHPSGTRRRSVAVPCRPWSSLVVLSSGKNIVPRDASKHPFKDAPRVQDWEHVSLPPPHPALG
jgi:hypothetical protein